tara:strand:- start:9 stop:542 length:534 start_codon:yes stop_codon:yes gene_type:complete
LIRLRILTFFLFFIFCYNASATSIAVVNIQNLIDKNNTYIEIIKLIEADQEKHLEFFKTKENKIEELLNEINDTKLLLDEFEINEKIDNYNQELNNFTIQIEDFNEHYQNQIINIRENILKQIIVLLENYAKKTNVDLILDSSSYLIASNSLNITDDIEIQLNEVIMEIEFESFEKN